LPTNLKRKETTMTKKNKIILAVCLYLVAAAAFAFSQGAPSAEHAAKPVQLAGIWPG
jgi:hypothetical protein